ncbi:ATP-binding cassette domain-containing protein [Streptomyces anthocyanicus]|uniref:ATP-binding cassette domain-containing protein n=1 Tax=Streptomyces anthocyanicus TaxID=68174 RepID=UPI0036289270
MQNPCGHPCVPAIEVANLTQRFNARLAVDRLSLSIPHGMFYSIVGPNGAGKTTALTAMCGLTGSRLGGAAVGGAIAAAAAGCAGTPLLAVVVPAVGTDARDRVYPGQQVGDPTGGQMTIFPVVLLVALLPGVIGGSWWGSVLAAVLLASAVLRVSPALTVRLLQQRGTGLLDAMISRDTAALRSAGWTRSPLTRPLETRSHNRPGGPHELRRRAAGHRKGSWVNPSPPPAIASVFRPTADCSPPSPGAAQRVGEDPGLPRVHLVDAEVDVPHMGSKDER